MSEQHIKITINTTYITLSQFIKLANVFESGGMIKNFIKEQGVIVNNEIEHRRGRKLYPNDVIKIMDTDSYIVLKETNNYF